MNDKCPLMLMTFVIHTFVTFLDEMRPDPVMVRESAVCEPAGLGRKHCG